MAHERLPTPAGSGYQPAYDIAPDAWELGRVGEDAALSIVDSLRVGATEVKHDQRAEDRIFVECYCQWSDGRMMESGILNPELRADNFMFVLADGMAITLAVDPLKRMANRILKTGRWAGSDWGIAKKKAGKGDEFLTIGVVLPLAELPRWIRKMQSECKAEVG